MQLIQCQSQKRIRAQFRGSLGVILKAVWRRCVLSCHLNVEKVCESRMVLSREFQTAYVHAEGMRSESKFHSRNSKKVSKE